MPLAKPPPAAGRKTPDPPHRPPFPRAFSGVSIGPQRGYYFLASATYCVSPRERETEKKKSKGK